MINNFSYTPDYILDDPIWTPYVLQITYKTMYRAKFD